MTLDQPRVCRRRRHHNSGPWPGISGTQATDRTRPSDDSFRWTEAQKRAYTIVDNKLTLNGGWDQELLGLEIGELEVLGFDLGLIGFSDDERAALAANAIEGLTDPDVVPDLPSHPVTRPGDL